MPQVEKIVYDNTDRRGKFLRGLDSDQDFTIMPSCLICNTAGRTDWTGNRGGRQLAGGPGRLSAGMCSKDYARRS